MNARYLLALMCMSLIAVDGFAAEEAVKKQATKEEIEARLAEHARKKASGGAVSTAAQPPASQKAATPPPTPAADSKTQAATTPAPEPTKVLPKVEVRKGRITELDRQLEKQNQEIAREKKNTKPTPLDDTLNGSKVSTALAFLGGQSSNDRSAVAKERVSMMEEERDMIEAIAQATSKEEKAELQKTLDSMRAMRRELEQSLR